MTVVIAADQPGALEQAAAAVEQGAVVGAPTDTVYGLVCLCSDAAAIDRLFAVKARPDHKALPVLLGDAEQATAVVRPPVDAGAQALIDRYWPGPLTLVLPARSHLPPALTAGGDTVGVRLPAHPFLRALARRVGPLASSSANHSGAPPCATAAAVLDQLKGRIPLLIDAGPAPLAQSSTVLEMSGPQPQLLREGPIGPEELAAAGIQAGALNEK
ncbi:MAG: threonylcarbamoyl-AMP synthase [Caldilineaceae bacterium SB0661_bin_32]|uniref:L-threonylcarbamoyladenylate synthase n=1 Tax=Caldilineaceae bacterium SB0661_bin_32 TaxID=2605255 RepID=A0A6B1D4G0_9CHLR|nr:threonylcarbamoyl-AMP synthase [Caldilineaceae bacterium SB0661_bin_32]